MGKFHAYSIKICYSVVSKALCSLDYMSQCLLSKAFLIKSHSVFIYGITKVVIMMILLVSFSSI